MLTLVADVLAYDLARDTTERLSSMVEEVEVGILRSWLAAEGLSL